MKHDSADTVLEYVMPIAFVATFITPGIWIYQAIYWLNYGEWQPISLADGVHWAGLSEPVFPHLVGLQKVSDFIMACPLSIGVFLCILGLVVAVIRWPGSYKKRGGAATHN